MSEPEKVRLVRCPKCENLLPELADYSVYQCGGCGAVLRAKNKNVEADTLSQKSDEDRVQGVSGKYSEKSDNFNVNEKRVNLSDGCENVVKSNGSSSRRADNREVLSKKSENQRNYSYMEADKWVVNNDLQMNENLDKSGHSEMGKEFEKLKPPNGIANGLRRSGQVADWRSGEGSEAEEFWRKPRRDLGGMRYTSSKYSEEGPSNYCLRYNYSYREPMKKQNKPSDLDKVEELEQDRVELLRKLNELKDQLSRSCDVNDKSKENVPVNRGLVCQEKPYDNSETWFPDDPWGSNRDSVQYFMPDAYIAKPPYGSHQVKPSPYYMSSHGMDMHRFYPPLHNPNQVQRFGVPSSSQMLRRAPHHPYFSKPYMHDDMDPFEPYPPNIDFHQPSCSCFHCYNERSRAPAPPPHPAFCNKIYPDIPNKSVFYHPGNPSTFCQRDYLDVANNPLPLNSQNTQPHTRWPSDLKSEVGDHVLHRPPRVVLATGGRRCRPVAGGAPFVTCYNCFELLQLPKKIFLKEKIQNKVRCGSCSTFILFVVVNKKLVVSVPPEKMKTLERVDDSPNNNNNNNITMSGCTLHSHGHANQAGMHFSSDDYDNSGYDFQSMDREVISSSTGQVFFSSKSAEMRSLHSTSPYSSEDENITESLQTQGEDEPNSAELEAKVDLSELPAGSPLEDHFDHSNKYHRFGNGSQSGRSEREKGEPKKATSRQNSMKDASLATEMEVSFNEYSNTGISQESGDANREDYQQRVTKGGQSFFAGIIKKSFKDFSKSSQTIEQSTINVTINGHPIPGRLLKKAEKLAGPIHPGQYWYDFRAGFWGVMGGPCLGIIPPFIEEFNHPMPEKCAGGNTGVFVNGRELHQKDLNLLGSRGLPTTKDRSYVIEISGRVLDKDSGEELDSLGKLAPTVEKLKHGFGMKAPRVAAQAD